MDASRPYSASIYAKSLRRFGCHAFFTHAPDLLSASPSAAAATALSRIRHRRYTHFSGRCRFIERTQTNHQVASGAGFRRCPENQTYEEQR